MVSMETGLGIFFLKLSTESNHIVFKEELKRDILAVVIEPGSNTTSFNHE